MTIADDIAAGRLRWASEPRLGGTRNEDRVGMTADAVWVLDGAGTPAGVMSCCDKDAAWYVERIDAALTAWLSADREAPLTDVLAAAIADVQDEHATGCPDSTSGRGPSCTVAIGAPNHGSISWCSATAPSSSTTTPIQPRCATAG